MKYVYTTEPFFFVLGFEVAASRVTAGKGLGPVPAIHQHPGIVNTVPRQKNPPGIFVKMFISKFQCPALFPNTVLFPSVAAVPL